MKKIGITGTIASGKTMAAAILRRHGVPVFNADQYSKMALHASNTCYASLIEILGRDVLADDSDIDPKKMSRIIFQQEEKRQAVNAVVHPFVKEGMRKFFASHEDRPFAFAEVPLLFEANWENEFDEIWVITASKEEAMKRMMKDRGYSRKEAEDRYDSQLDPQQQTAKADKVIINDGSLKDLDKEINMNLAQLRKECRHGTESERHIPQ